ncbi:hypothetical protein DFP73DRAFT_530351 [Morchella snyderi]|nr:hypothetical protein DFP73DRAFT_530351 [Morchella snyderi]
MAPLAAAIAVNSVGIALGNIPTGDVSFGCHIRPYVTPASMQGEDLLAPLYPEKASILLLLGMINKNYIYALAVKGMDTKLTELKELIVGLRTSTPTPSEPLIYKRLDELGQQLESTPSAQPQPPVLQITTLMPSRSTKGDPYIRTSGKPRPSPKILPERECSTDSPPPLLRHQNNPSPSPAPKGSRHPSPPLRPSTGQKPPRAPVTSLSLSVNNMGTVSVLAPPTVTYMLYTPFFEALTTTLNLEVSFPHNPYTTFRPAPTNVDLAIQSVPLNKLPNQELLEEILRKPSPAPSESLAPPSAS